MNRIFVHPWNADLGSLLLRLIFGGLFAWHGIDALNHYNEYLAMSHSVLGWGTTFEFNLVVYAQLLGGIAVALGFITRLAVLPVLTTMCVAVFVAHKGQAFQMKELAVVYGLLCLPILILGSGRFSIDRLLFGK